MRVRGCQSDTIAPVGSRIAATRPASRTSNGARKTAAPPSSLARAAVAAAQHVGFDNALRFLVVFAKGAVGASSQVALGAYLDHIEQLAAPQLAGLDGQLALRLDIGWPARPLSAPRARPLQTSSTR